MPTPKKNTAVGHSGNNTVLRIQLLFPLVNIFYVKYLIEVSTK